jgi:ABC-type Fe3+-hydroxamate transport system substrate-binding protein
VALAMLACSPAADERPRVVSLIPQGTRALANLGLSDRLVPPERIDEADLILVPPGAPEPSARGARVLEVAPHQFDEAFALYAEIAAALGDADRGRATAHRLGDPLGRISAAQVGKRRPLVAALVSLDPLELAGGHSFVTNLVEIAGAESITHGSEQVRLPARVDEIRTGSPELVVVALRELPDSAAQAVVRSWFAPTPVAFLAVDADSLWLDGALELASDLASRVEAVRAGAPAQ